ncbi:MAG: glycosyltransferase [Verrucomicrobiae bacterium]|nr:glycosyltransferase [Verrucomicrobiae bacterium]
MTRPLLSFFLISYNQEAFIEEAIEGAFAQTWSPLEILVVDDCSTDRTFELAQAMAARYRGPHQVRCLRTPRNGGIGKSVNLAMEQSRGELVIGSAGDDVSLPHRVEALFDAWDQTGRRATSLFSSYRTITASGEDLGEGGTRGDPRDTTRLRPQTGTLEEFLTTKWPVVVGCTHAWSPCLFEFFGPLTSNLEDLVLSFRSLAIGQMLYVHEPLVKYRRHGSNVSFFAGGDDTRSFEHRERRLRWVDEQTAAAYDNMIADLAVLRERGRLSAAECARLQTIARRERDWYATERELMDAPFGRRLRLIAGVAARGQWRAALGFLPRGLPRPVYRSLYEWRRRRRPRASASTAPSG